MWESAVRRLSKKCQPGAGKAPRSASTTFPSSAYPTVRGGERSRGHAGCPRCALRQSPATEGREPDELPVRKNAAGPLDGGLGPRHLIGRRLRHGEPRARPAAFRVQDTPFQAPAPMCADQLQRRRIEPRPRLAIGTGGPAQTLARSRVLPPHLHPLDDLPARTARAPDLGDKRLQSNLRSKDPLAAVGASVTGRQPGLGDEMPKEFVEVLAASSSAPDDRKAEGQKARSFCMNMQLPLLPFNYPQLRSQRRSL